MITVIDSIMGSGKTTFMMSYINRLHRDAVYCANDDENQELPKFIYITPTLKEVDRVKQECSAIGFCDPKDDQGRKYRHLDKLISQGTNICTTHALFRDLTKDTSRKLKEQGYVLVVDEALECVTIFDGLKESDYKLLLGQGVIYVDEQTKRLCWNHKDHKNYKGKFDHIRNLCDNGNLVRARDKVFIWEFPSEFLKAFDDVFILTYLFRGSPMASYFDAEGLDYEIRTIHEGQAVEHNGALYERARKAEIRKLITIHEGSLNDIGKKVGTRFPLSVGWFSHCDPKQLEKLRSTTQHFFKSEAKTLSADNAWTTFKSVKPKLAGDGYKKGFIPCNAKATNDYKEKKSLAYLCNIYVNTYIKAYFQERKFVMDEDAFALSEMLQWIWRSQIREGKPITVFIPSERMRGLLIDWLHEGAEEDEAEVAMAA